MNCWAMRTSRHKEAHREFVRDELYAGQLRQGWGYDQSQNLHRLQDLWHKHEELSDLQNEAARHWRMGNWRKGVGKEREEDYMKIDDLVVVPNVPEDGLFTICRVAGDYRFEISEEHEDFGHIRPVEVLTRGGISNDHKLLPAGLRRSFRCRLRLWNVRRFEESLNEIVKKCVGGNAPHELRRVWTPDERVDTIVSELITDPLRLMADRLGKHLPTHLQGSEWEPVLRSALEYLFPVSVNWTGGAYERGADIEIVIPNPFEEDQRWIVPVQVKDHDGTVEANKVVDQLKQAFESRSKSGRVIAVVLLVSNAEASEELKERMRDLEKHYQVPFVFCGRDRFLQLLAQGYLRRPMDMDVN